MTLLLGFQVVLRHGFLLFGNLAARLTAEVETRTASPHDFLIDRRLGVEHQCSTNLGVGKFQFGCLDIFKDICRNANFGRFRIFEVEELRLVRNRTGDRILTLADFFARFRTVCFFWLNGLGGSCLAFGSLTGFGALALGCFAGFGSGVGLVACLEFIKILGLRLILNVGCFCSVMIYWSRLDNFVSHNTGRR